ADGQSSGEYTDTLTFVIAEDAQLGEHLMRIKTNWNAGVPDDACAETEYSETEDYMLNIVLPTGTIALPEMDSELELVHLGNKQYEVSFISEKLTTQVLINLHNSLGINLVENKVPYINDRYTYPLDMSYASPGVYIIRMGTHKYGKVKKLVIN
ncbi:MAG TPA: GEVED domain-containing protein, partial [Bacteroidales bacterium]|nr:GEVED domain-containing protein [Bacteroidales bacterium]